jgi:hypothetical protein
MSKSRTTALAATFVVAAVVVVVISMNGGQSKPSASTRPSASPSSSLDGGVASTESLDGGSQGASSTVSTAGQTTRPRPTYKRSEAGGIYLDLLPAEEGGSDDRNKSLGRLTIGATRDYGSFHVGDMIGDYRYRISNASGAAINLTVRLGGRDVQDFSPIHPDSCGDEPCQPGQPGIRCSAGVCSCYKAVCQFGIGFHPSAAGPRRATLLVGGRPYLYLVGVGLERHTEHESSTSTSKSTSSTSVSTSGTISTSGPSGSTARSLSTTSTTHLAATSYGGHGSTDGDVRLEETPIVSLD